MNRLWQGCRWLILGAAGALAAFPLFAGTATNTPLPMNPLPVPTSAVPPHHKAPVEFFRALLVMPPEERERQLMIYPPPIHERLLAKIQEYEGLSPSERELRLRATELRWYLLPLLRAPPPNRATQLAEVPDDLRDLVKARLDQWVILPPPLQEEFLDNERALRYFTHVDSASNPPAPGEGWESGPQSSELKRWTALSADERKKIAARVNQFFELTPEEQEKTLNTLSDAEREQMGKTLEAFDNLSAVQRTECIRAFAKFASMNSAEKQEFLENAERWSQMTPEERQTWRDLVANVPKWPPLPPLPPQPVSASAQLPSQIQPAAATNRH
jgi:predicted Fe-S protein YdhL (DUF1289 family)